MADKVFVKCNLFYNLLTVYIVVPGVVLSRRNEMLHDIIAHRIQRLSPTISLILPACLMPMQLNVVTSRR